MTYAIQVRFLTSKLILLVLCICGLGGCATAVSKPSLTQSQNTLELNSEGVALLGVSLSNTHRISPLIVAMETTGAVIYKLDNEVKKKQLHFIVADKALSKAADSSKQSEEQMLSIKLPPGKYRLACIGTRVGTGRGCATVCADFELYADRVNYLGHLNILRRERKDDSEERAGDVIPIFDQWYTGYSTGTFDVVLEDNYEQDLPVFLQKYPALGKHTIEKQILAPLRKQPLTTGWDKMCGESV